MQRLPRPMVRLLCCGAWLVASIPAAQAADGKGPSRSDCANYNLPFDERLVRSCDAQYGLCAKPTAAWSGNARLMQTCKQIAHQKRVSSALSSEPLVRPLQKSGSR